MAMTPKAQVGKSRNARLNQAVEHARDLLVILEGLQGHTKDEHVVQKDSWQDGRNSLEQLTQCFHEANAYNNAVGSFEQ